MTNDRRGLRIDIRSAAGHEGLATPLARLSYGLAQALGCLDIGEAHNAVDRWQCSDPGYIARCAVYRKSEVNLEVCTNAMTMGLTARIWP